MTLANGDPSEDRRTNGVFEVPRGKVSPLGSTGPDWRDLSNCGLLGAFNQTLHDKIGRTIVTRPPKSIGA